MKPLLETKSSTESLRPLTENLQSVSLRAPAPPAAVPTEATRPAADIPRQGTDPFDWYEATDLPPPYEAQVAQSLSARAYASSSKPQAAAPNPLASFGSFMRRSVGSVIDQSRTLVGQKTYLQEQKEAEAREYIAVGDEKQGMGDGPTAVAAYTKAYHLLVEHHIDPWPVFFADKQTLRKDSGLFLALTHENNFATLHLLLHWYKEGLAAQSQPWLDKEQFESSVYYKLVFSMELWLNEQGRSVRAALLKGDDAKADRILAQMQSVRQGHVLPTPLRQFYKAPSLLSHIEDVTLVPELALQSGCKRALQRMASLEPALCQKTIYPTMLEAFRVALATEGPASLQAKMNELSEMETLLASAQKLAKLQSAVLTRAATKALVNRLFARQRPEDARAPEMSSRWRPADPNNSLSDYYELTLEEMQQPKWIEHAIAAGLYPDQIGARFSPNHGNRLRVCIFDSRTFAATDSNTIFGSRMPQFAHMLPVCLLADSESMLSRFHAAWPTNEKPSSARVAALTQALLTPVTRDQAIAYLDQFSRRSEVGAMGLTPLLQNAKAYGLLPEALQRWLIEGKRDPEVLFSHDAA